MLESRRMDCAGDRWVVVYVGCSSQFPYDDWNHISKK